MCTSGDGAGKQERIARDDGNLRVASRTVSVSSGSKAELEDLSLVPVSEGICRSTDKLQTHFANRQQYIDEGRQVLRDELQANEIPAVVTGRPKHLWSIYQKTVKTGREP